MGSTGACIPKIRKVLEKQGLFYSWYASPGATHLLKSSLIPCTYKNGTCTKSIAEAPMMQSVMHKDFQML